MHYGVTLPLLEPHTVTGLARDAASAENLTILADRQTLRVLAAY